MKKKSRTNKLIISIAIMLLISVALAFGIYRISSRNSESDSANVEPLEAPEAVAEEIKDEPAEVIFLASDYQIQDGWNTPAENLRGILAKVKEDGKTPASVIFCGDYTNVGNLHDYQLSPDDSIAEIREIVSEELPGVSQDKMIFEQGNHDQLTDEISESGLHEYDNYLVYVLNTEYDFPWKQGRNTEFKDRVLRASDEMKTCFDGLIANEEKRPVFIAGHVPIHFTARTSSRHSTGDNMYASYIFDVVNEAAKSLDIVYLFGHNHSKGWDCYLGGSCVYKELGDSMLVPDAGDNTVNTDDYNVETLNFTYTNAGYTGYYMNCGPEELANGSADSYIAADNTLTGTVCEIKQDEIVFTRYSSEGIHPMGSAGEGNPYKGGIDSGLIDSQYYSSRKDSSVHIKRKSATLNKAEEAVEEKAAA